MNNRMQNFSKTIAAAGLAAVALLSGCATKPPTVYQWQGYQQSVDSYFRTQGADVESQILAMEAGLEKIRAAGGVVPPGYQAHMGLLYGKQGKLDQFAQQLEAERKQFPESGPFVDFLLRNFKK